MEPEKNTETAYLERHGRKWRVSVPVPTTLRSVLGTRLKRVLDTESLEAANVLKRRVIDEFRTEIARARECEVAGRDARRRTNEAMALRDELRAAPTPKEAKEVDKGICNRIDALKRDLKSDEVSAADSTAIEYMAVAIDGKTPIDFHFTKFTKSLKLSNPYTIGYPRTLDKLIKFMEGRGVEPYIENVDDYIVADFRHELSTKDRPNFLRIIFYWDWLVKMRYAEHNPFGSGMFPLDC